MKPALATEPVFLWAPLTRIRAAAPPRETTKILAVMIFAVVVWLNNAPSLAAAHHRASPCRFGIAPAYDDAHHP